MDAPISLDRLSWFLAVAETGSFTAAALRLVVPKSSLSRRIDRLEREVGVRLLHRTTRRVSLRSAGATLFEGTVPAMRALREVFGSLPERAPGRSPLRTAARGAVGPAACGGRVKKQKNRRGRDSTVLLPRGVFPHRRCGNF